jgi:hypothetical protein
LGKTARGTNAFAAARNRDGIHRSRCGAWLKVVSALAGAFFFYRKILLNLILLNLLSVSVDNYKVRWDYAQT